MRCILFSITLILNTCVFGQDDFCHPKKVERVVAKLVGKLSKEEFKSVMRITKDSAVENELFMIHERNTRELNPIYEYLASKGCDYFLVDDLEEVILEYTYYKMHKKDTCISELLQPYLDNYFVGKERYSRNIKADSIGGVYIPRNLEECFKQIDLFWTDSLKIEVKNMSEDDFGASAHFGFGRWMRNNWGLWGGSRLKVFFNEMKIHHPDDMSGIIIKSYHRYLTGRSINLESQTKYYQEYWKKAEGKGERKRKWWEIWKNKNRT